jgi:hypothetical protein
MLAKSCGAKHSTLPILFCGATVIQGSGAIIDWAESKTTDRNRSLTPTADLDEAKDIERRADEIIGPHVRRLAFAELLPSHAHLIKKALFYKASGWRRLAGNMMWPVSWRAMYAVVRSRAGRRSREPREAGN